MRRTCCPRPAAEAAQRRNEPQYLPHIVATIAACRGATSESVAAATTANALQFFGFDVSSG